MSSRIPETQEGAPQDTPDAKKRKQKRSSLSPTSARDSISSNSSDNVDRIRAINLPSPSAGPRMRRRRHPAQDDVIRGKWVGGDTEREQYESTNRTWRRGSKDRDFFASDEADTHSEGDINSLGADRDTGDGDDLNLFERIRRLVLRTTRIRIRRLEIRCEHRPSVVDSRFALEIDVQVLRLCKLFVIVKFSGCGRLLGLVIPHAYYVCVCI